MVAATDVHIEIRDLTVRYGAKTALAGVSLTIPRGQIFGIIGPANSGKTTLLKCINRTIDFVSGANVSGQVLVDGSDVFRLRNVYELRRRVGMVFPLPVGLPLSVYENVAYAPRRAGLRDRAELDRIVEQSLRQSMLWDEVKDRLDILGTRLSGGQQQRLTLAGPIAGARNPLPRRVLDRHRPGDDDEDRGHSAGIETPDNHRAGHESRAAVPASGRSHGFLQCLAVDRGRRYGDDLHPAQAAAYRAVRHGGSGMNAAHDLPTSDLPGSAPTSRVEPYTIQTRDLNLWYGNFQALKDVVVNIKPRMITSLIGPSGCGKTTLLRCFNRINERYENVRTTGEIRVFGRNIYDQDVSLSELRKSVGMVFQRPNPLPISIYDNVLFGVRLHMPRAMIPRSRQQELVETALRDVQLWDDVKDRLRRKGTLLTLEQQQKLCLARLLPLKPRVILMDEPCSALDAEGVERIEELVDQLREKFTIVMVTHNMGQARRISEECIFMLLGRIVEHGPTLEVFLNPRHKDTEMYVTGRYG